MGDSIDFELMSKITFVLFISWAKKQDVQGRSKRLVCLRRVVLQCR
jgi:hypothetical protein